MAGFTNYINKIYLKNKNYIVNEEPQKPKISVIIPCYNVEKYLEQCLESLLKQTCKNFEIICIDDGSEDFTNGILIAFAHIDKRIKFIAQKNAGPSIARNKGLTIAKGEYISFVDADDWVDENYFENLLNAIERNNCDIAVSTIVRKRKFSQKYRVYYTEEKVYTNLQDKLDVCKVPTCSYIWNKLYKKELIQNWFFKEGVYFEDMLWLPEVLKRANGLVTVAGTNYYYRVNPNSIVKLIPSNKKQNDLYCAQKYIAEFFERNDLYLSKKARTFTKEVKYFLHVPVFRVKEFEGREIYYCLGLKIFSQRSETIKDCKNADKICNSPIKNCFIMGDREENVEEC